jgi:hypothetical protein
MHPFLPFYTPLDGSTKQIDTDDCIAFHVYDPTSTRIVKQILVYQIFSWLFHTFMNHPGFLLIKSIP